MVIDMTESDAIKLFKSLADKSRLMILKSLAEQPMYVELLAKRLNLTPPTISFHLKKLEEAGVVNSKKEQYYTIYSLKESILNAKILDIIKEESSEKEVQEEREEQYHKKVIESFFEYGKLKSIPVQRKKKRIILDEIAKAFESGRIYTEREVNITIADYHDDFCTIRRDMISEKILTRNEKGYQLIKKD
ncbi:DUF2087 domain-containing protein [Lachnoclostridium sp.]|nr:metalloregulator ArsR/SmtB family transcription factor [Lachnoclostridium sp.]